MLVIGLGYAWY
jgi:hypothetical protein